METTEKKRPDFNKSTDEQLTQNPAAQRKQQNQYLECEQPWVYLLLIFTAGWFGAYTFLLRGGVFCNAQTANVVLFATAIGTGNWPRAGYLLIPISAYFAGSFFSEHLGKTVKRLHFLRWGTMFIGIELLTVLLLGAMPENWPDQICQIALNFICSMQFNIFRQVKGIGAATTFVTNHIRQVGSSFSRYLRKRDAASAEKIRTHGSMILCFVFGGIIGAVCCNFFGLYSIWGTGFVLLFIFARLAYADLTYEKYLLPRVPHGH